MKFLRRKYYLQLFAAFALLLYTLLPFFAVYQFPAHANAKNISSIFGDKVLICTSEGFRMASWEDLLNGKEQHKPHPQYKCPVCYVAVHGQGLKPPLQLAATTPLPVAHYAFYFPADDAFSAEHHWRKFRTRSPPASFVS